MGLAQTSDNAMRSDDMRYDNENRSRTRLEYWRST